MKTETEVQHTGLFTSRRAVACVILRHDAEMGLYTQGEAEEELQAAIFTALADGRAYVVRVFAARWEVGKEISEVSRQALVTLKDRAQAEVGELVERWPGVTATEHHREIIATEHGETLEPRIWKRVVFSYPAEQGGVRFTLWERVA